MDVLGPLDLRDHDHVEGVADLGHRLGDVVEEPGRVERVEPGPELGGAEVDALADRDQAGPGLLLVGGRDAVLQVAQDDVDPGGDVGHLGHHLVDRRWEEVDHPAGSDRDLPNRFGGTDGQRSEEVLGAAHEGQQYKPTAEAPSSAGWSRTGPLSYRSGMSDQLLYEVGEQIATITFNRPTG